MRLDHDQVRALSNAIATEQGALLGRLCALVPDERGEAQCMPATGRAYGLRDPFDPGQSIEAQARLMRDLMRRFASVPLALAAYNAGPAPVRACGCVPPFAETRGYVARILGLLSGAGDATAGHLQVRLVE